MLRVMFDLSRLTIAIVCSVCIALSAGAQGTRPVPRDDTLPGALWDKHPKGQVWTRATLSALSAHGTPLLNVVPSDIATWCPAYAGNDSKRRAAFWVGLISTLVEHESTFKPRAVGGDGRWFGLLQISPGTARGYDCRVGTGAELQHGPSNLSCAVRIMAQTVTRDGAIARRDGKPAGVAADWGPMTRRSARAQMSAFTRSQPYCSSIGDTRPIPRP